jgi:uncharacterized protein with GYD domain
LIQITADRSVIGNYALVALGLARPNPESSGDGAPPASMGESAMPTYVILMNWTEQGAKNCRDTLKRAKDHRAFVEELGGKVREHLYTLGEYDIVMVTEFPDDETEATAMLQLATFGNVHTKSMRAFTDEEAAGIITRLR